MEVSDQAPVKVRTRVEVKKFGPEWTPEQIASGEAVPYEVMTLEEEAEC